MRIHCWTSLIHNRYPRQTVGFNHKDNVQGFFRLIIVLRFESAIMLFQVKGKLELYDVSSMLGTLIGIFCTN